MFIRSLSGHAPGSVNAVKFSSDGNYCMTAADDRQVMLWNPHIDKPGNAELGLHIKSYSGVHGYQILDLAITTDNAKFASVGGMKIRYFVLNFFPLI